MVGNYIKLLEVLGVNIHKEVEVFKCQKGFKYGNSQKEITNMCCLIPTYVGGQRRKILCYTQTPKSLQCSCLKAIPKWKRSPQPLSRQTPCKTPFPNVNASFNKP